MSRIALYFVADDKMLTLLSQLKLLFSFWLSSIIDLNHTPVLTISSNMTLAQQCRPCPFHPTISRCTRLYHEAISHTKFMRIHVGA